MLVVFQRGLQGGFIPLIVLSVIPKIFYWESICFLLGEDFPTSGIYFLGFCFFAF